MMTILISFCVLVIAQAAPAQRSWPAPLQSPDGRTSIQVMQHESGDLVWRVTRDGKPVLLDSPLGIRRADQAFESGLTFVSASDERSIDEHYTMPHGKRRERHVVGRERTLTFANAAGARVEIVLRAHDDGVAFRYRFPERDPGEKTVADERTGFHVPDGSAAWLLPHQQVHKYGPAYEELWIESRAGERAPRPDGWSFPALFRTPQNVWLLVTESGLDEQYCGSHLAADVQNGVYRLKFPDPKEGLGVGAVEPVSSLPWTIPWRVVIVGDAAGRILESDLVDDLAPATTITDTSWIRPGRAAWSWWSQSDSPKHAEALNEFTDLAAEMGWEYALVDANWNVMQTGTIDQVVAHAKAKRVGLLFWYNSGGPHNEVSEAPRDRMHIREVRREEFATLQKWGVKGVKVDFWHSDKQDRIRQYRDLLADAAEFHLMVDFHGCTMPRGWAREFPNLIGMEAVFGAEQYKFNEGFAARAASHNSILPFTRNVVGAMDYTPVTFSDARYPHQTTNAHELALSVVFETPVQHFADSAVSYRALPQAAKTFLMAVPTAWDETRALSGAPGKSVVVARRSGRVWYVGGINGRNEADTVTLDLGFLDKGEWTATVVRDGAQNRAFATETRPAAPIGALTIAMRPRGGFVVRLAPRGQR